MPRNFVCTECGGELELGIIVDRGHGSQPIDATYWMEGVNEKGNWWTGGLTTKGKKKHYISALRCKHCGLLKFYAGPDYSETDK